ncbi:MAG: alpha/beta fold hydrolase, partial [Actinobacteria bacterium]|nr:alpha/beta fold hydrolase [Actinomycetota bacterium]
MSTENYEQIEFVSEGAVLRGRLYRPTAVAGDKTADVPVLIMAHGFSVLAAYLDDYATDFAQAGFAVLLFDHRNFGESDGTPRYGFDNLLQIRGYRDAINFVTTQPGIDKQKITVFGESATSLVAQFIAVFDDRVRAVISATKFDISDDKFAWLRANWSDLDLSTVPARELAVRMCRLHEGEGPVIVEGDAAVSYTTRMRKKYQGDWSNQVFILQRKLEAQFNEARLPAKYLKVPTLFVIATDDEVPVCELSTNRQCFDLI